MISRQTGGSISSNDIKKLETEDVEKLLEGQEKHVVFAGQSNLSVIGFLQERIRLLEKMVLASARLRTDTKNFRAYWGSEKILALVIMYETGAIGRFKAAGNYVSYCRCVKSNHLSNGKKKGSDNRKTAISI